MLKVAESQVPGEIDGLDLAPLLCRKDDPTFQRTNVWHFQNLWGGLSHADPRKGPDLGPSSTRRRGDGKRIYDHTGQRFERFELENDLSEKHD